MIINYKDGSLLKCSEIIICNAGVIADGIYCISIDEIESITEE